MNEEALVFEAAPDDDVLIPELDPIRLPPELKEKLEYAESRSYENLSTDLVKMHIKELKMRAYEVKKAQGKELSKLEEAFYEKECYELDNLVRDVIQELSHTFEDWLKRHTTAESWVEEIFDTYEEQGLFRKPSEAFYVSGGGWGSPYRSGFDGFQVGAARLYVGDQIVEKFNEKLAAPEPDIPEDHDELVEAVFKLTSDIGSGQTRAELEEMDDDELHNLFHEVFDDLHNEEYLQTYSSDEVMEHLDNVGWQSEVGNLVKEVLEEEAYPQWKRSFPGLEDIEVEVKKAYDRLEEARTLDDQIVAITRALNTAHWSGVMGEHAGLSQSELDELDAIGKIDFDWEKMLP